MERKQTIQTEATVLPIGRDQVKAATQLLRSYKEGRAALERRIVEEEQWYNRRQTAIVDEESREATSAWLFSSICNRHADAMDNYPTAVCLPREPSDTEDARMLSDVLPVILEKSNFEGTYSANEWYKIKHGIAAYGAFWDSTLENGLGDIRLSAIHPLNLFWEPGVSDIQDSRNVFVIALMEDERIHRLYPHYNPESSYDGMGLTDYRTVSWPERTEDGMTVVVDWYYKTTTVEGRTLLHYCKFAKGEVLFASENDPAYAENGWYAHGLYPIELDVLYPVEGTPSGYGMIAVGRNPQTYIDRIDGNLLHYLDEATHVRYLAKKSAGINLDDFNDSTKKIVEVEGDIDEERFRQMTLNPLDRVYMDLRNMKVDELKETTGNRDISQGSTLHGVTAASAILALQEAGQKGSRDSIATSYRMYVRLMRQVIELVRQFYTEERCFRITGADGYRFVTYSNKGLVDQVTGYDPEGRATYRRPVFDIDVKAARMTPYEQERQNEIMKELFTMGVFAPERAHEAEIMLEGMHFSGIQQVKALVKSGA